MTHSTSTTHATPRFHPGASKTSMLVVAIAILSLVATDWAYAQQSRSAPGRGGFGGGAAFGGRGQFGGQSGGQARGNQQNQRGGAAGQRGGGGGGGIRSGGGGLQSVGNLNSPVQTTGGGGGGVRLVGIENEFEPAKEHEVVYKDIPGEDSFDLMSLTGPMAIVQFLDTIALVTGWNIMVTSEVEKVALPYFQINDMSPVKAIELLQAVDLYYEFDESTKFLRVSSKEDHLEKTYGKMVDAEFEIHHAILADIETIISAYKSPEGVLLVDPRTATLYIHDTPDNIEYMEKAVKELDVPVEPITIELTYINVEAVLDVVESMLSEAGEIRTDSRTNQITVIDHSAPQKRIEMLLRKLDRELDTRTWILDYAYPDIIADQISLVLPEEMGLITYDEDLHQITVSALEHRLDEIDGLIEMWDRPRKQVQIETYLLTASSTVARNLGINWSYFAEVGGDLVGFQSGGSSAPSFNISPAGGQNISIGQLPFSRNLLDPLTGTPLTDIQNNPLLREFRGSDVSVVIDYLETQGEVTVLAQPLLTVQDGQEAVFENTTQVPFSQSTADRPVQSVGVGGGFNTSFRSISRIDFIDVGTILRVLPRISENGDILLDISAEDSSFVPVIVIGSGEPNTVPQKTQNRTETQVMVRDQETIVIGGLRSNNFSNDTEKLPLLGDIPLLGRLFRTTNKDHQQNELLIFITPTIVDTSSSPEANRLAKAEAKLGDDLRYDKKSSLQRIRQAFTKDKDEISVTIGQKGDLLVNQTLVSMADIRHAFYEAMEDSSVLVVLREHPRAPKHVAMEVTELAMEAGLKLIRGSRVSPFVPHVEPNPVTVSESAPIAGSDSEPEE